MKELINHSNYMLFNYGWIIFGVSLFVGIVAAIVLYKIEQKSDSDINPIEDSNFIWDEYGNPTIKE